MNIVIICSTNGSVLKKFLADFKCEHKILIVSDRYCGVIEYAKDKDIEYKVFETNSGEKFSNFLYKEFKDKKIDLFISFYTKLLKGFFVERNLYKLINFHPSVLPSCPGLDGFGDTIKSGSRFFGSTVHFIDKGVDTGKYILQSVHPLDHNISYEFSRHRLFLQQVVSLAQIIDWFDSARVKINNDIVEIKAALFKSNEFSPNLDLKYEDYIESQIALVADLDKY